MAGGYSIGIDFGTTNSSLAILRPGSDEPELVRPNPIGTPYEQVIGTEVYFPPDGASALVGRHARNRSNQLVGRDYLRGFKRSLTKQPLRRKTVSWEDTGRLRYNPYLKSSEPIYTRRPDVKGEPYGLTRLIDAIAAVLGSLVSSDEVNSILTDTDCITFGLPIQFGDLARLRLLRSAHKAGLVNSWRDTLAKIRFLQEPAAIALDAFQGEGRGLRRVFVYDHGGGTLDLSVLEFEAKQDQVFHATRLLGSHGSALGGTEFDKAFLRKVVEPKLRRPYGDMNESDKYWVEIFSELLKIDLSRRTSASRTFPDSGRLSAKRTDLEGAVNPLIEACVQQVNGFLGSDRLDIDPKDIDVLVLAGGMSCMPCIQERIRALFPHVPDDSFIRPDPTDDGSVERALTHTARGLARYGASGLNAERTVADIKAFAPTADDHPIALERDTDLKGSDVYETCTVEFDSSYPGMSIYLLENHVQDDFLVGYEGITLPAGTGSALDVAIKLRRGQRYPSVGYRWAGSSGEFLWLQSLHELEDEKIRSIIEQERSVIVGEGTVSWTLPCADICVGDYVKASQSDCVLTKDWFGYIRKMELVSDPGTKHETVRMFDSRSWRISLESEKRHADEDSDYRRITVYSMLHLDLVF